MKKLILAILLIFATLQADSTKVGTNAVIGAALYGGCVYIDRQFDVSWLDDRVCGLVPVAYTVGAATIGDQGTDALGALIVPTPLVIWSIYKWGDK